LKKRIPRIGPKLGIKVKYARDQPVIESGRVPWFDVENGIEAEVRVEHLDIPMQRESSAYMHNHLARTIAAVLSAAHLPLGG
jgi:hypothetical protein